MNVCVYKDLSVCVYVCVLSVCEQYWYTTNICECVSVCVCVCIRT